MSLHGVSARPALAVALAAAVSGCGLVLETREVDHGHGDGSAEDAGGADAARPDAGDDGGLPAVDAAGRDAMVPPDALAPDASAPVGTCAMPIDLATAAVVSMDPRSSRIRYELFGDTRPAMDAQRPPLGCECAAAAAAPEQVFVYTPPENGRLEVDTYGGDPAATFDTVLYVSTLCPTRASSILACNNDTDNVTVGQRRSQVTLPVVGGEPLYIVVDGCGEAGAFGLVVRFEPIGTHGTCGNPIPIGTLPFEGETQVYRGDNEFTLDHGESPMCSCSRMGWGNGNDLVFAYTATRAGVFTATTDDGTAMFDTLLHARSRCMDDTSELGCHDDVMMGSTPLASTITFSVLAGDRVFLFADACRAWSRGSFTLRVSAP